MRFRCLGKATGQDCGWGLGVGGSGAGRTLCLCQTGPWTPCLNSMEKDVTGKGCSQEGVV